MAWTDLSNTESSLWPAGRVTSSSSISVDGTDTSAFGTVSAKGTESKRPNQVASFSAVPGFDDGYSPVGIPDPIANNIDQGGGGGPTRPSSGFLYPRGDC